jgi:transposase
LQVADNITLLPLPPYAAELNPMENIWDYLRGNKLSRRVWQSYEAIVAACKDAWLFLTPIRGVIHSIAHRSWASVNL